MWHLDIFRRQFTLELTIDDINLNIGLAFGLFEINITPKTKDSEKKIKVIFGTGKSNLNYPFHQLHQLQDFINEKFQNRISLSERDILKLFIKFKDKSDLLKRYIDRVNNKNLKNFLSSSSIFSKIDEDILIHFEKNLTNDELKFKRKLDALEKLYKE